MKHLLLFLMISTFSFFIMPFTTSAQVECDDCGYCIGRQAPGNWDSCRDCIYDKTNGPASSNETLEATKTPGKYYTQLGCLDVGPNSFTDPSAPGGLLNFLLSRLIFPIVGTLSFFSLLYGAFLLMTAQGSSEQIGRGKSYVVGAIVGLIFTLSAVLIINILAGDILRIPGFSQDKVGSDLSKIKRAVERLQADTGKLPGGLNASICIHNPETNINSDTSGLYDMHNSSLFPNWQGPYLTKELVDPEGKSYFFDPDYACRPDVSGCEGLNYNRNNAVGRYRVVQALVYLGPDGEENYCNDDVALNCERKDQDNRVLILC